MAFTVSVIHRGVLYYVTGNFSKITCHIIISPRDRTAAKNRCRPPPPAAGGESCEAGFSLVLCKLNADTAVSLKI